MREIIEKQRVKTFINKVLIEWRNETDRIEALSDDNTFNLYLRPDIIAKEAKSLFVPKIYIFVDFETPITLNLIDSNFETFPLKISKDKSRDEY